MLEDADRLSTGLAGSRGTSLSRTFECLGTRHDDEAVAGSTLLESALVFLPTQLMQSSKELLLYLQRRPTRMTLQIVGQ